MERPYTVALHGGGALPAATKIVAEIGFIDAIERTLGDPQQVAESYRAAAAVEQAQATATLAQRWSDAYRIASDHAIRVAALEPDARFELRLTPAAGPA